MYSVVLMAALTAGGSTPECHGCCGCYGGYGGGCCGCYGGCMGCYGGCMGCMGCYGGCMGCYGGCMGCMGGYGCWGGYGSWGGYSMGAPAGTYPGTVYPGPGTGVPGGEQLGNPTEDKTKKGTTLSPTRARLIVEVPANSKLFIDDMPIKSAPGLRSFNTPSLEPGQAYYYMVRVETVATVKRFRIRAA